MNARAAGRVRETRLADGLTVGFYPLDTPGLDHAAWRDLAARALVENIFYEPEFVLAGAGVFGARPGLLVVAEGAPWLPGARLLALWPCRSVRRWGLPLACLEGLRHGFSIFGAPLVDGGEPERALAALLAAPRALGLPPRLLMPYLPLDGPLADRLDAVLARLGSRRRAFSVHARGFLDVANGGAGARARYLDAHLSASKARQIARLARRMAAAAPVRFETIAAPDELGSAFEDYLALERAGWKGRAGTAAGDHPGQTAFLRRVVEAYGAQARLRIDRLRRDGRSLAVSIGLHSPRTFWYFKISYAEDEARNSPGGQLALQVTRSLLDDPAFRTADSCAPPGFTLLDPFWGQRRRLADVLVEAGGRDRLFGLAVRLETLRLSAMRQARRLRAHLRAYLRDRLRRT